ncbi:MAG: putative Rossmann fold flavoprotein [Verrucomicrobiales bacterium]|jgi:predicted Rossmann fold flavoprotein
MSADYDLVVAGGGAAGFFGAITCAEFCPDARVVILEKSPNVLSKVKISGGGRCNVTHACFDPRELVEFYPRGSRQLIGPLNRWAPGDTMDWFEERGVPLKIEADNRVFPKSDSSQSIIDCLNRAAKQTGVEIRTGTAVERVSTDSEGEFEIAIRGGETLRARRFLLTTGGTRSRIGEEIAAGFGHRVEPAAPSLFTFKISDPRLTDLPGLSVGNAAVRVEGHDLSATGPVLITHWGLSGPGILRVSAWGARELQKTDYRFEIVVNWTDGLSEAELLSNFARLRNDSPRRAIVNDPQFGIPSRLWKRLVESAAAGGDLRWPHLPRDLSRSLASQLGACRFRVDGKSMNKDEFVNCGGVCLDEVNFKTMESRLAGGLHFAGEVLDIDGITGGFNFQSAWTTGRIAGEAAAAALA